MDAEGRRNALHTIWPLFGLRVRTPMLELRYPTDEDLAEIAEVAAAGVHDPATMPFTTAWTDMPPPRQQVNSLLHHWLSRGSWSADSWHLPLVVVVDGALAGMQAATAKDFPTLREVVTGSWLGRSYHGRKLGTEMRHAILHLAFEGLGATQACSGAFDDNAASLGVSRKIGYEIDGRRQVVRRGEAAWQTALRLGRERWEPQRRDDIEIVGLESCLGLFGLDQQDNERRT